VTIDGLDRSQNIHRKILPLWTEFTGEKIPQYVNRYNKAFCRVIFQIEREMEQRAA
jgi:hypothetical protein